MQELNPRDKTTADDKNLLTWTHRERYGQMLGATLRKTPAGNSKSKKRKEETGEHLSYYFSWNRFIHSVFYVGQRKDLRCINRAIFQAIFQENLTNLISFSDEFVKKYRIKKFWT